MTISIILKPIQLIWIIIDRTNRINIWHANISGSLIYFFNLFFGLSKHRCIELTLWFPFFCKTCFFIVFRRSEWAKFQNVFALSIIFLILFVFAMKGIYVRGLKVLLRLFWSYLCFVSSFLSNMLQILILFAIDYVFHVFAHFLVFNYLDLIVVIYLNGWLWIPVVNL